MSRTAKRPNDESGAALLLALIFVIVMALMVIALTDLSSSNILNTSNLQGERAVEYAADGAMHAAIQTLRYEDAGGAGQTPVSSTPCPSYPSSSGSVSINGIAIRVDCVGQTPPANFLVARQVKLTACYSSDPLANPPCPSDAILQAQVLFVDLKSDGITSALGFEMNVQSWQVVRANG